LAVTDAATVDGRRHLILIRRDNVEHLLMIGGPTDIVVEPNIVRAAAREPALTRPPAFVEATQHPATQLEAPPRPQQEPVPQHANGEPPVPLASRPPAPRVAPEPQPPGAAAETVFTRAAEHNSAEAAQRLVEAVLLRRRQPMFGLRPSPETQSEPQPLS
jgi:hypothetical protein